MREEIDGAVNEWGKRLPSCCRNSLSSVQLHDDNSNKVLQFYLCLTTSSVELF